MYNNRKTPIYYGKQNADFIDGVFDPQYIYIVPQPVKDAWHDYTLYTMRQKFVSSRIALTYGHSTFLVRDIYVEEYNFYKMTLQLITKSFVPTIELTAIRHPDVARELSKQYEKMKNILEKKMNDVLIKLMDLFKN